MKFISTSAIDVRWLVINYKEKADVTSFLSYMYQCWGYQKNGSLIQKHVFPQK